MPWAKHLESERYIQQHLIAGKAWENHFREHMPNADEVLERARFLMRLSIDSGVETDYQHKHMLHFQDSHPYKKAIGIMQAHGINPHGLQRVLLNVNHSKHWQKFFFSVDPALNHASSLVRVIKPEKGDSPLWNAKDFTETNEFFGFTLQHLGLVAALGNRYEEIMRERIHFPILNLIPPERIPMLRRGITNNESDKIKRAMVEISKEFPEGIAISPQMIRERLVRVLTDETAFMALVHTRSFWTHSRKARGEELHCVGQGYVGILFHALGQVLQEPAFAADFEHAISIPQ